jgi:hypothetical protein
MVAVRQCQYTDPRNAATKRISDTGPKPNANIDQHSGIVIHADTRPKPNANIDQHSGIVTHTDHSAYAHLNTDTNPVSDTNASSKRNIDWNAIAYTNSLAHTPTWRTAKLQRHY